MDKDKSRIGERAIMLCVFAWFVGDVPWSGGVKVRRRADFSSPRRSLALRFTVGIRVRR